MKASSHKEPHWEDKGQWVQVAPGKVISPYKKGVFYSENSCSLKQSPQGCCRVPIAGGFPDMIGQGAR